MARTINNPMPPGQLTKGGIQAREPDRTSPLGEGAPPSPETDRMKKPKTPVSPPSTKKSKGKIGGYTAKIPKGRTKKGVRY